MWFIVSGNQELRSSPCLSINN